ncbi:MAG: glycosyl hydrolase family 18 protein, partial [Patescibacteria group bacterium]
MRDGYIKIIKEYIGQKIQRNYTLDQIKADVIRAGATPEEFNESLNQLTIGVPHEKKAKTSGLLQSRKFILAFLIFFVFSLGFILINQASTPTKSTTPVEIVPKTVSTTKSGNQGPIAQVYANSAPIDPERAFSYPKSNVLLVVTSKPKKEILGFFPYWMLPKADDINLSTLTSVSLFGLEADGKGNIVIINSKTNEIDPGWQMWKDPLLNKFIKRARDSGLKVFLTLKAFDNNNIESLVSSDVAQKAFISNALYLASSKNLDGINLDFEYVGTPSPESRNGFTRLVTNLGSELKRQFPNAILTIDTYAISGSVPGLFELELLSKHVDAFVIMGYDLHIAT